MFKTLSLTAVVFVLALTAGLLAVFRGETFFPFWQRPTAFIQTADQKIPLVLETADTPEKQARGLMYRKKMASNAGMDFPFETVRRGTMWMKNTYIPLDMLFYDTNNVIRHIHLGARPHDESIISTPMPVRGVIEVNAGFVAKHNIQTGDKILFRKQ